MRTTNSQQGFAAVEVILFIIILAIIGFTGWFVYHSQQAADKTFMNSGNSTLPAVVRKSQAMQDDQKSTAKELVIKEWGIKIPYTSEDTLSYSLNSPVAEIISANLAKKYNCDSEGSGSIIRYLATDTDARSGTQISAETKQYPGSFKEVGNYFYTFSHSQSSCSPTVTPDAQNAANDFLSTIFQGIQAE